MDTEDRRHETRRLKGGELLALTRPPGGKWSLTYFEHSAGLREARTGETVSAGDGVSRTLVGEYTWRNDMPEEWLAMRFDSPDDAVKFVEGELAHLQRVEALSTTHAE